MANDWNEHDGKAVNWDAEWLPAYPCLEQLRLAVLERFEALEAVGSSLASYRNWITGFSLTRFATWWEPRTEADVPEGEEPTSGYHYQWSTKRYLDNIWSAVNILINDNSDGFFAAEVWEEKEIPEGGEEDANKASLRASIIDGSTTEEVDNNRYFDLNLATPWSYDMLRVSLINDDTVTLDVDNLMPENGHIDAPGEKELWFTDITGKWLCPDQMRLLKLILDKLTIVMSTGGRFPGFTEAKWSKATEGTIEYTHPETEDETFNKVTTFNENLTTYNNLNEALSFYEKTTYDNAEFIVDQDASSGTLYYQKNSLVSVSKRWYPAQDVDFAPWTLSHLACKVSHYYIPYGVYSGASQTEQNYYSNDSAHSAWSIGGVGSAAMDKVKNIAASLGDSLELPRAEEDISQDDLDEYGDSAK